MEFLLIGLLLWAGIPSALASALSGTANIRSVMKAADAAERQRKRAERHYRARLAELEAERCAS